MTNKNKAFANGVFFNSLEKMLEFQAIYQKSVVSDQTFEIECRRFMKDCRLNMYEDETFTNNELQIVLAECFCAFISCYREICANKEKSRPTQAAKESSD